MSTLRAPVTVARVCFFFQAEDGIRDVAVTGVQTCALPISGEAIAAEVFLASGHPMQFQQRLLRLRAWAGWAVAAVLALAFTPFGRHILFTSDRKSVV